MRHILVIFSIVCLLLINGCADNGVSPLSHDGIVGTVVDGAGRPVAGAAIGLVYSLDGYDLPGSTSKAVTSISFVVPTAATVSIVVHDHAGDHVITLMDAEMPAGEYSIKWYAVDAEGQRVPTGIYHVTITVGEAAPEVRDLFLYDYEPPAFLAMPNAVTDENGRFQVPLALIPVGEEIVIAERVGELVNFSTYPIAETVLVLAVTGTSEDWISGGRSVTLPVDSPGVATSIIMPAP